VVEDLNILHGANPAAQGANNSAMLRPRFLDRSLSGLNEFEPSPKVSI
jgi:hypothetical protein